MEQKQHKMNGNHAKNLSSSLCIRYSRGQNIHQLGKIHFRIFHQLFSFDPVTDYGLGIKDVWRLTPHIVAFGPTGMDGRFFGAS